MPPSSASAFQVIGLVPASGSKSGTQAAEQGCNRNPRQANGAQPRFSSNDTKGRENPISCIRNRFAVVLHSLETLRVEGRETNPARGRGDGVCHDMKMHICPVYSDVLKVLVGLRNSPV
jgi:hypothetical protein